MELIHFKKKFERDKQLFKTNKLIKTNKLQKYIAKNENIFYSMNISPIVYYLLKMVIYLRICNHTRLEDLKFAFVLILLNTK